MKETTDEDVIRWAAEWVGWEYKRHPLRLYRWYDLHDGSQDRIDRSLPDLAEAVRVKWWDCEESMTSDKNGIAVWSDESLHAFRTWGGFGSIPFLRAVIEVVKGE